MSLDPIVPLLATSINAEAAGGVGLGLIAAFAVVLLVSRSDSPENYGYREPPRGRRHDTARYDDRYEGDGRAGAQGGLVAGIVIFALGAILRFVITSPTSVLGINLQPVGNVLMLIGGLSFLVGLLLHLRSR